MVAHDMKSSVAIIGGFVLRIMNKATSVSEEKQTKYLQIIKKEVVKLESTIVDFLEFSRLRAGKLKLNFSATSVDTELMELFEAYHHRALKSGINLELQSADALPIIEADAQRLNRVFTNLLDNALKFSQEGGKITIATEETDQNIIVKFIDEGRGIDPRDRPHIFEPFHRGHARKKRDGFGLGLAAVRTLVEGHGGWVRVESELGKGSVFTVVLPKTSNDDVEQ
jgi:signal transduction histidine kinase